MINPQLMVSISSRPSLDERQFVHQDHVRLEVALLIERVAAEGAVEERRATVDIHVLFEIVLGVSAPEAFPTFGTVGSQVRRVHQ